MFLPQVKTLADLATTPWFKTWMATSIRLGDFQDPRSEVDWLCLTEAALNDYAVYSTLKGTSAGLSGGILRRLNHELIDRTEALAAEGAFKPHEASA